MSNPLLDILPSWAYVLLVSLACSYLFLHATRFMRTVRKHTRQIPRDNVVRIDSEQIHRLMHSIRRQRERAR